MTTELLRSKFVSESAARDYELRKRGTRIINLPVPLCFRSSCLRALQGITNFGSGALMPGKPAGTTGLV